MTLFLCTITLRSVASVVTGTSGAEGRGFESLPAYHLFLSNSDAIDAESVGAFCPALLLFVPIHTLYVGSP